ncbi:CPBP family glutamic-type intramembrane protease [Clostridium estertheticum]|uniref:CPBP family glutamic-type intramembrane protease n=1 Tax=Clostridium estertheticum TaxID=238834 RepID=UPI001CF21EFC|nr:CPBP family intramembrane metalloprotease [Clostridium estertheticum]
MKQPLYLAIALFPLTIIGCGLEEIGWRGFLQPALQEKHSIIMSTLIGYYLLVLCYSFLW